MPPLRGSERGCRGVFILLHTCHPSGVRMVPQRLFWNDAKILIALVLHRRQTHINGVDGNVQDAIKMTFPLKEGEFSPVIEMSQNYGIIRLLEKIGFDEEKFTQEKDILRRQVLQQKQNTVFRQFIEDLKQKAIIVKLR